VSSGGPAPPSGGTDTGSGNVWPSALVVTNVHASVSSGVRHRGAPSSCVAPANATSTAGESFCTPVDVMAMAVVPLFRSVTAIATPPSAGVTMYATTGVPVAELIAAAGGSGRIVAPGGTGAGVVSPLRAPLRARNTCTPAEASEYATTTSAR